jgi:hypothetical protein
MTTERNTGLEALFGRLPSLDQGELFELAGAHDAEDPVRAQAWTSVQEVVSADHLERDLDEVRSEVGAWATRLGTIAGQQIGSGMSNQLLGDARRAAAPAVLDAAVALLLGARLPESERAALLGPWDSVVGG